MPNRDGIPEVSGSGPHEAASGTPEGRAGGNGTGGGSPSLLTVEDVAARLQVSPEWVYRNSTNWPFRKKLSPKVLRFDAARFDKWLARLGA